MSKFKDTIENGSGIILETLFEFLQHSEYYSQFSRGSIRIGKDFILSWPVTHDTRVQPMNCSFSLISFFMENRDMCSQNICLIYRILTEEIQNNIFVCNAIIDLENFGPDVWELFSHDSKKKLYDYVTRRFPPEIAQLFVLDIDCSKAEIACGGCCNASASEESDDNCPICLMNWKTLTKIELHRHTRTDTSAPHNVCSTCYISLKSCPMKLCPICRRELD
jgi:hypothetical protein